MMRDERFKLIYYPVGNRVQLFDMRVDPDEMHDLGAEPAHAGMREELIEKLIANLYGTDLAWLKGGKLVGLPDKEYRPAPNRGLSVQRGWRFM